MDNLNKLVEYIGGKFWIDSINDSVLKINFYGVCIYFTERSINGHCCEFNEILSVIDSMYIKKTMIQAEIESFLNQLINVR